MSKQVEPVEPVEPDTWPKTLAEVSALFSGKTGTELYAAVAAALRYIGNPSWVTRCAAIVLECNPPAQTPYLRVIDEELIGAHLGVANTTDTYAEAKAKVNKLIAWHIQVATDPAVNGGFELKPAQTPPPRLKVETFKELAERCDEGQEGVEYVVAYGRDVETAVRKQFGVNDE